MTSRSAKPGFTIVELMVAVAIFAILAAVAVPSYFTHMSRALQGEAKVQLSLAFAAEAAFRTEVQTYTSCIYTVGVNAPAKAYYAMTADDSFANDGSTTDCGPVSGVSCLYYSFNTISGPDVGVNACTISSVVNVPAATSNSELNYTNLMADTTNMNSAVSKSAFVITAWGTIVPGNTVMDKWSINNLKVLANYSPAIK